MIVSRDQETGQSLIKYCDGNAYMLLYVIESAVPLLSGLFIWAAILALKGDYEKHKKVAMSFAIVTWLSYIVVIILVRFGHNIDGKAPEWIVNLHMLIIYYIPPALALMAYTGITGKKPMHKKVAISLAVAWLGALVTGAMIFITARGYV